MFINKNHFNGNYEEKMFKMPIIKKHCNYIPLLMNYCNDIAKCSKRMEGVYENNIA